MMTRSEGSNGVQFLDAFDAVHGGQIDIHQQNVRTGLRYSLQGGFRVGIVGSAGENPGIFQAAAPGRRERRRHPPLWKQAMGTNTKCQVSCCSTPPGTSQRQKQGLASFK
jgi:hypothetical protein